eukprot:6371496-Amphidinium_carterae.1
MRRVVHQLWVGGSAVSRPVVGKLSSTVLTAALLPGEPLYLLRPQMAAGSSEPLPRYGSEDVHEHDGVQRQKRAQLIEGYQAAKHVLARLHMPAPSKGM